MSIGKKHSSCGLEDPPCKPLVLFSCCSPWKPLKTCCRASKEVLEKVHGDLRSDRYPLRNYTYHESPEIVELGKNGKPRKTQMMIYEVFSSTVQEITYRRLVSKNGKPLAEAKLRKQDREHAQHVRKYARKSPNRGLPSQSELEASKAQALQKQERALHELFQFYEFTIQGRDFVEGHQTLILAFTPRPKFKVTMKKVEPFKKVSGMA